MNRMMFTILGIMVIFLACAALPYTYYGIAPLEGESLRGTLLAKDPSNDKPLERCQADETDKGKCVVLFTNEFERIITDLETTKQALKDCQSGNGKTQE